MNVTIYDNGGRSFDRYTVILHDFDYALGIGDTGNVPNGFCMSLSPGDYIEGPHLGKKIMLENITEPARKAVLAELEWAEKESQR